MIYRSLMFLGIAAIGCAPPRATKSAVTPEGQKPSEAIVAKSPAAQGTDAFGSASDFLAKLSKGETKASQLSEEFKKQIARPRNDDERKLGYSESLAQDWLDKFAGPNYKVDSPSSVMSNEFSVIGTAIGGPKPEYFVLRFKMLPGKPQVVNWFHRSSLRVGDRVSAQPVSPDVDAARDFLEVACSGNTLLTPALMSPEFKMKLAEPLASDKEIGYNPGMLNLKMKPWQASAATIKVGNDLGTFTGELTQGDKKVNYSLKMANYQGNWLAESFEVK